MTPFSIDHIDISDQLIEIHYWISHKKQAQSVLFRIPEFEQWLQEIREVRWDNYWDNWQPQKPTAYSHRIVNGDLERFFEHKMSALTDKATLSIGQLQRPMHKVSGSKSSNKSQSA